MKTCSICGKEFPEYGNNPSPFDGETCCNKCNKDIVLPLRRYLAGDNKEMLLVIEPNGTLIYVDTENNEAKLDELQLLVGGYIELYPTKNEKFHYIVDEEGLLKGKEPNELANTILGIDVVGPVVLCPRGLMK